MISLAYLFSMLYFVQYLHANMNLLLLQCYVVCHSLNSDGAAKCTTCMTFKNDKWTCGECGTTNRNEDSSCSCCLKLNVDRLQKNFARLQHNHAMTLANFAHKEKQMVQRQSADSKIISQLQQRLRDLTHSYHHLKTREKRLSVTLQDANFDLEDASRFISQLQHRLKTQDSVLKETASVATDLHEKRQAWTTCKQTKM